MKYRAIHTPAAPPIDPFAIHVIGARLISPLARM
jgi:hypothetical protein